MAITALQNTLDESYNAGINFYWALRYAPATPVYWALQFVPQGQKVANINSSNQAQILQANQFVIDAGVLNTSNQRIRVSTKYGRNLNSGDSVYLCLMQNVAVGSLVLQGLVAYSVAFK